MIAPEHPQQAVLAGHHVLFTTAAQLLLDRGSQDSARGLARRLKYYGHDLEAVRAMLGHARLETTQVHAHIRPARLKQAVGFYE